MQPRPTYPNPPGLYVPQQSHFPPSHFPAGPPPPHFGVPAVLPPPLPFNPQFRGMMPPGIPPGIPPGMPLASPIPPMSTSVSMPAVIVGAPVMKAPIIVAPPTWTPPNPLAITPLTLYIGKIPAGMKEETLVKVLEACGKVQKWSRPTDAATGTYKLFGFCTFATGTSALRCNSVLSDIDLAPFYKSTSDDAAVKLQVKAGSKEQAVLESLAQMEKEAAFGPDPTALDLTVRQAILQVLRQEHGIAEPTDDISAANALAASKFLATHATAPVLPSSAALLELGTMDDDDPNKEKLVLSEIEKFRIRQAQRDKEVEQLRKEKLKTRIELLKQKQEQLKTETDPLSLSSTGALPSGETAVVQTKRRSTTEVRINENNEEEANAKRRRKQEVLEMLGAEPSEATTTTTHIVDAQAEVASSSLPLHPAGLTESTVKMGMKLNTAVKSKMTLQSSMFVSEEATAPIRQIVPLDITDEERRAAQYYDPMLSSLSDESADAIVLAQRQALAIAASLKSSTPNSEANALPRASKLTEKELVDLIPTDRQALFAYPVDWNLVEKEKIIEGAIHGWIVRKMIEYLGEDDNTLTNFITSKLRTRCVPLDLLVELEAVLDEEAEPFVLKLWRLLIFSILKCSKC